MLNWPPWIITADNDTEMKSTGPDITFSARGLIAVALNEPTTEHARAALRQAARVADIVELRLDLMVSFDLPRLLAERPCPVIVTCRAAREGGRWDGSEEERLDVLRRAIDLGAEYVDVEADAIHLIRERGRSRLIASCHDFSAMPADLPALWQRLAATGADVVKIVGMAHDARDVGPVLQVLANADRPTIAIAMGPAGLATRVLALRYQRCLLTFCALETGGGTAPGQIGATELVGVYNARHLSEQTAVVGLLGPEADIAELRRWNQALRRQGQDRVAVPFVVPESVSAPEVLSALQEMGVRALIVAPPFQEVVGQALDELENGACRWGRVNLIEMCGGRLVGCWVEEQGEVVARLDEAAVVPS
jgi:3-dehydroquinate dehydratase / shikimate dehydrogenase